MADRWPPGTENWTVEYAQVDKAFGRLGGAGQLIIKNENGEVMTVEDLLEAGVLR